MKKKALKYKPKKNELSYFFNPQENYINIKCSAIEQDLVPEIENNYLKVKAIVEFLNSNFRQEQEINFRQVFEFKTLVNIEIPNGFRLRAVCNKDFTMKGLYVTNCFLDDTNCIRVVVTNLGPMSPVIIKHKEYFANVYLEPIQFIKMN